jgi:hypothetical protein
MKNKFFGVLFLLGVLVVGIWLTIGPQKELTKDPYRALISDHTAPPELANKKVLPSQIPTLQIKGPEKEQVRLTSLQMTTYLENGFARTLYDLVFENPHERELETEFEFPLQANQTITRFELEVNGELRPAVAVEKQQARIAYEATVRRGVDPGLLEKVEGNVFKMRVYPLLPKAPKRMRIEVCSVLEQDATTAYFRLPLKTTQALALFKFRAIEFRNGQPNVLKQIQSRQKPLNQSISLQQKLNGNTGLQVDQVGKYQYLNTNLSLPRKYARKKAPKCLTVCWDASSSRSAADLKQEYRLLENYLKWIKNGKLELIFFAHQVLDRQRLKVVNGEVKGLSALFKKLQYDGASSLSSLSFGQFAGDEILLFTDGLQTLGSLDNKLGKAPIYPINSSELADRGLLRHLALQSNGTVLDLRSQSAAQALQLLKRTYLKFVGFKEQVKGLEYYHTNLDPSNERLMLSIKAPKEVKRLTAQFGLGPLHVLAANKIDLKSFKLSKSGRTQYKRWALAKLESLEEQPVANKKQICTLSLKHQLVSSASSLLVLDSLSDYLTYRIVPPPSLRKAYFKALPELQKQEVVSKVKMEKSHLRRIKKEWKDYQSWYWKKPKKEKKPKQEIETGEEIETGTAVEASPPPPPPATDHISQTSQEGTFNRESNLPELNAQTNGVDISSATTVLGSTSYTWSSFGSSDVSLSSGYGSFATTIAANSNTTINGSSTEPGSTLAVAPWNPKVPYLKSLRRVPLKKAYECYLDLKVKYAAQPSFYIDVCDFFIQKKQPKNAVRVLSNLAEMQLKDAALLRVLAQKLVQLKSYKMAIGILKSVIELRPEEPQSYRDYGLALAQMGKFNEAVHQLYKVVKKPYDGRFEGIHLIALNEINHLIAQHPKEIDTKDIPSYFLLQLPMDIRIVLNWDADNTDVDLWVTEPNQEKCMYSYKLTSNGGRISNDFTQGYGPEEYLIRKAPKGTYQIQAHYYGNHRPTLSGKAILTVQFYQYYGTPYEIKREVTRRLSVVDEELDLATFEFE